MAPDPQAQPEDGVIEANTLPELFAQAAGRLCDFLAQAESVMAKESRTVELHAVDVEQLLLAWLRELIVVFETEGLLFSRARVKLHENDRQVSLKGQLWGEPYDPSRHGRKPVVKTVDAGALRISQDGDRWRTRLVACA